MATTTKKKTQKRKKAKAPLRFDVLKKAQSDLCKAKSDAEFEASRHKELRAVMQGQLDEIKGQYRQIERVNKELTVVVRGDNAGLTTAQDNSAKKERIISSLRKEAKDGAVRLRAETAEVRAEVLKVTRDHSAIIDKRDKRIDLLQDEADNLRKTLSNTRVAMAKAITALVMGPCITKEHQRDNEIQAAKEEDDPKAGWHMIASKFMYGVKDDPA